MFLKKLPNVSILFESGRKCLTDKSVWLLQSSILSFNVIDKSYRQVLTPVNNSQLLLMLRMEPEERFKPYKMVLGKAQVFFRN